MRYLEIIFETNNYENKLKSNIFDLIIALKSEGIDSVNVKQLINSLKNVGVNVDKKYIYDILDPDKFKVISKIMGDVIYFVDPKAPKRKISKKQKDKEYEKIKKMAKRTINLDMKQ